MTQEVREKILKIMDGFDMSVLMYHISECARAPEIYDFLIKNNLMGKTLYDWWLFCGRTSLSIIKTCLMQIEKNKDKKIYAGKDIFLVD